MLLGFTADVAMYPFVRSMRMVWFEQAQHILSAGTWNDNVTRTHIHTPTAVCGTCKHKPTVFHATT